MEANQKHDLVMRGALARLKPCSICNNKTAFFSCLQCPSVFCRECGEAADSNHQHGR